MNLYIHVKIGNETMLTGPDVVSALIRNRLNAGSDEPLQIEEQGAIYDTNGNRVGSWHVQENEQ